MTLREDDETQGVKTKAVHSLQLQALERWLVIQLCEPPIPKGMAAIQAQLLDACMYMHMCMTTRQREVGCEKCQ